MNNIDFKDFKGKIIKYKKLFIISFILFLFIIYMAAFISPKIYVTAQIHSVTDLNYENFVKSSNIPSEKITRDNCRFITVYVKILKPFFFVRNVKIEKVSLKEYLDDTQYFNETYSKFEFLGSYNSNSRYENSEGIDVYLDGMTEDKLRNFFNNYKIEVSWVSFWNRQNKKIFYLKDCFE